MSVVFGPVSSRRFGRSLGVDLSPQQKCCNFDCVYCELSASKPKGEIIDPPSVAEILTQVKAALKTHQNIDVITLTANGEPTLYPNLRELIEALNSVKSAAKTLILSNGTGVVKPEIFEALKGLDIVKFSLDSATQKTFRKIDHGGGEILVAELIDAMAKFRREFNGELVLEILVVATLNDTQAEFEALNRAVNKILPARVDISTIDRPPAYPVKGVSTQRLGELASMIYGVPCSVASVKYSGERLDFSKTELLDLLSRRPQSETDVEMSFSEDSKVNLRELLTDDKIYETRVAGVKFYRAK